MKNFTTEINEKKRKKVKAELIVPRVVESIEATIKSELNKEPVNDSISILIKSRYILSDCLQTNETVDSTYKLFKLLKKEIKKTGFKVTSFYRKGDNHIPEILVLLDKEEFCFILDSK